MHLTLILTVIISAGNADQAELAAPDSLIAPVRCDTINGMELILFPPGNAALPYAYQVSWGDGETLDWTMPIRTPIDISRYHRYRSYGEFTITVRARDSLERVSDWSRPITVTAGEQPLKWVYPTFNAIVAAPTLDTDGNIYVGDDSGLFYSVTPEGQYRWHFETKASIYAAAAFDKGRLYVPSLDSHLYCLDTKGKLLWQIDLDDELYTAPAISRQGDIYIGSDSGRLYSVDSKGRLRWTFQAGEEISSSPTIGPDGLIYLTADSVYCLDSKMRLKWTFGTPGGDYFFAGAVPDREGTVYAPNTDGFLYAIQPDGRMRWRAPVPDVDEIRTETVFGPGGTIFVGTDGYYLCRKVPDGTIDNIHEADDIIAATPALSENGTLYVLPDDGSLNALTTYGRPVWIHEIAEDDKDTYYGSSPTIAPDGTVYVGSWDGGLYAFEGDGAPAKTLWPQYRHDAQHTGRVPAK